VSVRAAWIRLVLALARLPALGPVDVDAATGVRFAAAADALLGGSTGALPEPRLDLLRWLAEARDVVFHGSPHGGLAELSTERKTRDATAFGDQQAVFASTDPVWALYFACHDRGTGFEETRNGTIGRVGGPLYPRSYFFSHNRGAPRPARWRDGFLYVLPRVGFESEPPLAGVVDTAHLVSHEPVRPLACVAVGPSDFPFTARVTYHRPGEPIWISLLRRRPLH
jgi:hypothetical protein